MDNTEHRGNATSKAREPEDLAHLFNARANAGDVEGLVALYEPSAVLAVGTVVATGHDEIRQYMSNLLSRRKDFPMPDLLPALINGSIAVTSARSAGGNVSVEVARQQSDGSWLWLIDQLRLPKSPKEA